MNIVIWWRRQRAFLDFCLSSLLRRKFKNGSLLAAYALMIFMLTSVLFFAAAIREEATAVLSDAPEIVVQRMVTGRYTPIPLSRIKIIEDIRGVRSAKPRYWGYYFHPAVGANYTLIADAKGRLKKGRVDIGAGVARTWSVGQGDSVYLKAYDARVIALTVNDLLPRQTELVSADLILVHPDDFQDIFNLDRQMATDVAVSVRNPREVQTVAEKIAFHLPDCRTVLREEMVRTYAALFDWRSGYMLVMLGGCGLAFFIFALDKATGLSAQERGEVAILKAIGWDTSDVLVLKFYEGLVISLSAFGLGVLGAYLHVYMADGALFEHAIKGWSVLLPRFKLIPSVDLFQLSAVLGLTVVPYALITIVPAWRAATTDPDRVMRQL